MFGHGPQEAVTRAGSGIANTIHGGDFGDTLLGRSGGDTLLGHSGDDDLRGGIGDDRIGGGAGRDRLVGNSGDDVLTGGAGKDVMLGGSDADTFRFLAAADTALGGSRDLIKDFQQGLDTIDLSAIADFTLLEAPGAAFTGAGDELRVVVRGDKTIVSADLDGDQVADFQIGLAGVFNLTRDDFGL